MTKYPKLNDGDAFRIDLDKEDLKFACCSCGHVHVWQFHHVKGNTWDFAVFTDRRATGQLRRHNFGAIFPKGRGKHKNISQGSGRERRELPLITNQSINQNHSIDSIELR